jgi:hypothetical protein
LHYINWDHFQQTARAILVGLYGLPNAAGRRPRIIDVSIHARQEMTAMSIRDDAGPASTIVAVAPAKP